MPPAHVRWQKKIIKSKERTKWKKVVRELKGQVRQVNLWVPSKEIPEKEILQFGFKRVFHTVIHSLSAWASALKTSMYKWNAYNYSNCRQMRGFDICCWVSLDQNSSVILGNSTGQKNQRPNQWESARHSHQIFCRREKGGWRGGWMNCNQSLHYSKGSNSCSDFVERSMSLLLQPIESICRAINAAVCQI